MKILEFVFRIFEPYSIQRGKRVEHIMSMAQKSVFRKGFTKGTINFGILWKSEKGCI